MISFLDNRDRIGALLLLVFSLFYLMHTHQIPLDPTARDEVFTPRTLPTGLAVATIVCCLLQIAVSRKSGSISAAVVGYRWMPALLVTVLMLAYSLLFDFLGFLLATILFLFGGFLILGERNLWLSAAVAAGLSLFMWFVLTQVFELYLDNGSVIRALSGIAQ